MNPLDAVYTPSGYDSSYNSILKTLYNVNNLLKNKSKDGISAPADNSLDATLALYRLVGHPLDSVKTIHVGGTNGKGSTSHKIAQCLQSYGYKTGLFVSPHLSSFRERIQINSVLISEDDLIAYSKRVLTLCVQNNITATLFELTFIIASLYFKSLDCDFVVLEVGCGGIYDATNVVATSLSIICSVSLDHTKVLGSTVEDIALNKSGIFKNNVHGLIGPGCPYDVCKREADNRGAVLHTLQQVITSNNLIDWHDLIEFSSSMTYAEASNNIVDTDKLNSALSISALILLKKCYPEYDKIIIDDSVITGIVRKRPPCRWESHHVLVKTDGQVSLRANSGDTVACSSDDTFPVEVIFDVGHNPAAIAALVRRIKTEFSHRIVHIIYGVSRDKDVRQCLKQVLSVLQDKCVHFTHSNNYRAVSTAQLRKLFQEETGKELDDLGAASITETVKRVLLLAATKVSRDTSPPVVIICGTGFILPEARQAIGIIEPVDECV
jgi:dihydrofolate synthase/folylpolyglutamate synthase